MCYAALQTKSLKTQLGPYQFDIETRVQGDLLDRVSYPLQKMYFVRPKAGAAEGLELVEGQFGLVPDWVDDTRDGIKFGRHCYNARSESVFDKPSFRKPILQRRAIIPVNEYYEIADLGPLKGSNLRIRRADSAPILFAGLWEFNGRYGLSSCSIITSEPMGFIKEAHSRSPILIDPKDVMRWLSPELKSKDAIQGLLKVGSSDGLFYEKFDLKGQTKN